MVPGVVFPRLLFNVEAAADFLRALGANPSATHYRAIHWDKTLLPKEARAVHVPPQFGSRHERLEQLQQQGYRLYWLPNGGPNDADVSSCSFLFVEWDEQPIEWQIQAWQLLGLPEPTVLLNTGGKSIHCYWRLREPIEPDRWRAITARLIRYCNSDPTCKNPSRLMRLAGSAYIHKSGDRDEAGRDIAGTIGPSWAAVIHRNPVATYSAGLFETHLPELPPPPPPAIYSPSPNGAAAPDGEVRTLEELERLVASYPAILKDNDQYTEARDLAAGFIRAFEESGGSRAAAIALLSKYHPQAEDTFEGVERWNFTGYGTSSFIALCKRAGVDVSRRDRPKRSPGEPPLEDFVPDAWAPPPPLDDEDRVAMAAAAEKLRSASDATITLRDVLPDSIAAPLTKLAAAYPADQLTLLLPLLTIAASIVGNRCRIRVKETWDEPFVLWGMNVATASAGKSPMAEYLLRPLTRWAVDLKKAQQEEMREWKTSLDVFAAEQVNERKAAVAEWKTENPPPAPQRELFVMDATLEKIGSLQNGARTFGFVSFHDELSTWFAQHQRSGKGGPDHRSNWNSLWNGRTLKVDRQQGESFLVANTAISVFGSTTLALYEAQAKAAMKANHGIPDPDGMQARFLLCLPEEILWQYNPLEVATTDLLLDLYRRIDEAVPPCPDPTKPAAIAFDPFAWEVFEPLLNAIAADARESAPARAQWLGKLRGNAVRVAGTLHVIDHALKGIPLTAPIGKATAERALQFVLWQVAQFDRLQAKTGGDIPGLEEAVAKLIDRGVDWRKEHGSAPVPCQKLRDWRLPGVGRKAADVVAWMLRTVGEEVGGPLGWVERRGQTIAWHPPTERRPTGQFA
jgi:hypothetical protein